MKIQMAKKKPKDKKKTAMMPVKHSKEDLHESYKHMKKHGG
jgi:hypothetical protein